MGTLNRQPAGQPTGGQFATTARAETGTSLTAREPTAENQLVELAMNAFPEQDDIGQSWVISRVDAQRAARVLLADLSDDAFFNEHWFGIESAAIQRQRFINDVDGEEADTASPADTLDVDLYEFQSYNEPDRPGENGYMGYDFPAYAEAIADAWRGELKQRVARAVAANAEARTATTAGNKAA